jgi:hypothetical protein
MTESSCQVQRKGAPTLADKRPARSHCFSASGQYAARRLISRLGFTTNHSTSRHATTRLHGTTNHTNALQIIARLHFSTGTLGLRSSQNFQRQAAEQNVCQVRFGLNILPHCLHFSSPEAFTCDSLPALQCIVNTLERKRCSKPRMLMVNR